MASRGERMAATESLMERTTMRKAIAIVVGLAAAVMVYEDRRTRRRDGRNGQRDMRSGFSWRPTSPDRSVVGLRHDDPRDHDRPGNGRPVEAPAVGVTDVQAAERLMKNRKLFVHRKHRTVHERRGDGSFCGNVKPPLERYVAVSKVKAGDRLCGRCASIMKANDSPN
jgi:hypothetical protein